MGNNSEHSVYNEFILFFVTIFSFFFLQLDYFTKMRNIFLFFYLPCVILEAKTFQRKTDMETDGVASPARRNQLDRQRHPPGRGRSWSTWVNDYKDMMDPSKCTSRAHDHSIADPCVDGRRMGCRHRNPIGDKYGYRMCWRDQSGDYWEWLFIYNQHFRCESDDECKYVGWYYNEHGAFAGGYAFNGEGRSIYNEIRRRVWAEGGQP